MEIVGPGSWPPDLDYYYPTGADLVHQKRQPYGNILDTSRCEHMFVGRHIYDWAAVQAFFDAGNGFVACAARFGFTHGLDQGDPAREAPDPEARLTLPGSAPAVRLGCYPSLL